MERFPKRMSSARGAHALAGVCDCLSAGRYVARGRDFHKATAPSSQARVLGVSTQQPGIRSYVSRAGSCHYVQDLRGLRTSRRGRTWARVWQTSTSRMEHPGKHAIYVALSRVSAREDIVAILRTFPCGMFQRDKKLEPEVLLQYLR